ncbi:MAG: right-handed parallel beta-helix repeat-containing protein [Streptomyces sp.]|nr:right-handed parallel beta-helix repeat-containing protein [Streptomyces sp.]
MTLYTFGGNPSAVLTTSTGDVVPNYPLAVRVAGSGALVTALFEENGTTPISTLRTNAADDDMPGAIRTFKASDVVAIEYEYLGPSGDPVRWYEVSREAATQALEGLGSKLDKTGGEVDGDLDVAGTVNVQELLVNGAPLDLGGADWTQLGIRVPAAVTGAALQNALNAARDAGGGWVIVRPGVWDVSSLPLRIYRNTRLTLCDGAIIRRAGNGTMLLNGDASQNLGGYTGHGNILVEGGTWDARAASYPTSAMCMSFGHAEDITVQDTTIKDVCGFHGIEMNATRRGRILRVAALGYKDPDGTRDFSEAFQIDLAKGSSYFGGFGPYDDTPCTDILVEGCSVGPSGTAGTTSWPRGFGSHSASPGKPHTDIRVRDFRCEGLTQFAVGGYTWQDTVVSGLQLRNCGAGVRMRTLDSSATSARTPAGGSSPTITGSQPLQNIVIDDITMTGGGTYDAVVRCEGEDTGYIGGLAISNIVARNVGQQCLRLVDVEDYTVDNVIAYGCGATAISQLGTRRGRLKSVHINGATGAGITVDSRSTPAASATDVAIQGCSVTGATANGFHIWDGTDVIVDDCDAYALTGFGVQVSTSTVRPIIRNVRTRDTTSAGINITNTVTQVRRHGNTPGSVTDASTMPNTSVFETGFGALEDYFRPPGRYETMSRLRAGTSSTPTSGILYLVPIWLPKGAVISNLGFVSGGTAAATPTNWWFALCDNTRKMLARTADQLTAAWAANTAQSLPIAQTTAGAGTSYTTTYTGVHFIGIMVKATTVPSIVGEGLVAGVLAGVSPGFGGADSGMSTPPTVSGAGFTAAAFGVASGQLLYGYAT